MEQIELNLTVNEVNEVLAALAERPFRLVADLIAKVHKQASNQVVKPPEGLVEG
jgi:hypothetical protein